MTHVTAEICFMLGLLMIQTDLLVYLLCVLLLLVRGLPQLRGAGLSEE